MGGGPALPYDAEVEYVETKNNSQFVDTGIYASEELSFYVDYDNANTGDSPYGNAFGDKTNVPCYRLTKYNGGLFRIDGKDVSHLGFNTAGRHTISYDGVGNVYVDGSLKKRSVQIPTRQVILLFYSEHGMIIMVICSKEWPIIRCIDAHLEMWLISFL